MKCIRDAIFREFRETKWRNVVSCAKTELESADWNWEWKWFIYMQIFALHIQSPPECVKWILRSDEISLIPGHATREPDNDYTDRSSDSFSGMPTSNGNRAYLHVHKVGGLPVLRGLPASRIREHFQPPGRHQRIHQLSPLHRPFRQVQKVLSRILPLLEKDSGSQPC